MTRFWRSLGLGAAALLGAVIAVLADLIQKENAAAVLKIASIARDHLQVSAAPIVWVIFLVILGIGVAFVNQPRTTQGAFYAGASIVALIMTVVPYKTPLPPASVAAQPKASATQHSSFPIMLAGAPEPPGTRRSGISRIQISVSNPGDRTVFEAVAYIHGFSWLLRDRSSDRPLVLAWSTIHSGETARNWWEVPSESVRAGEITVRLEASGHQIATQHQVIADRQEVISFDFMLQPADAPLWWQRLFRKPL